MAHLGLSVHGYGLWLPGYSLGLRQAHRGALARVGAYPRATVQFLFGSVMVYIGGA